MVVSLHISTHNVNMENNQVQYTIPEKTHNHRTGIDYSYPFLVVDQCVDSQSFLAILVEITWQ